MNRNARIVLVILSGILLTAAFTFRPYTVEYTVYEEVGGVLLTEWSQTEERYLSSEPKKEFLDRTKTVYALSVEEAAHSVEDAVRIHAVTTDSASAFVVLLIALTPAIIAGGSLLASSD